MEEKNMWAMISQPMRGKSDEEIEKTKVAAVRKLCDMDYSVLDTYFNADNPLEVPEGIENKPLYYLAASLQHMAICDAVYFCKGWENARGCQIQHAAAEAYGLKIIEED